MDICSILRAHSERATGSRFVEVDAAMMRGGIGSVNEMEF
jgi:hypothetical protein